MLTLRSVDAGYGAVPVLVGLSLSATAGEILAIVGANGAGKTTALRAIAGLVCPTSGSIVFGNSELVRRKAAAIVSLGIALVPQGRLVFPDQTVLDNLVLGAFTRPRGTFHYDLEAQFARFPVLAERQHQLAGTLSGGEQQMLAIARALMSKPRLLLLDEPSLGLAPRIVEQLFVVVKQLQKEGLTLIIVEQMVEAVLRVADRVCVLERGRVVFDGRPSDVGGAQGVAEFYLGPTRP